MKLTILGVTFLLVLLWGCPKDEPCVGDCNGDGRVTEQEMQIAMDIAMGAIPLDTCPSADANGDGKVTVDELQRQAHDCE